MRKRINQRFAPDVVSIYNITETLDGFGDVTKTRVLAATVKGEISNPSGSEKELIATLITSGIENTEAIKLRVPYGTAIEVNQEVNTADNKQWNIVYTDSSMTYTAATIALLTRQVIT